MDVQSRCICGIQYNMRNKNLRKQNSAKRNSLFKQNVPTSAIEYKGPIRLPSNDQNVVSLFDNATISVSAGGAVAATFNNNPSSARNWTEMSTSWAEYRVLGIKFKYNPILAVNTATAVGFSGYNSIIHTPTAPTVTTLAQAAATGASRPWNAFRPFVRTWRMSEASESVFVPCGAPGTTSQCLTLYAEGGGISIYYGNIEIEYLIQFRTHAL